MYSLYDALSKRHATMYDSESNAPTYYGNNSLHKGVLLNDGYISGRQLA